MNKPKLLVVACHLERNPVEVEYELRSMFRNSADAYLFTFDNLPPVGTPRRTIDLLLMGGEDEPSRRVFPHGGEFPKTRLPQGYDLVACIEPIKSCKPGRAGCSYPRANNPAFGPGIFKIAMEHGIKAILLPKYDLRTIADYVRG